MTWRTFVDALEFGAPFAERVSRGRSSVSFVRESSTSRQNA